MATYSRYLLEAEDDEEETKTPPAEDDDEDEGEEVTPDDDDDEGEEVTPEPEANPDGTTGEDDDNDEGEEVPADDNTEANPDGTTGDGQEGGGADEGNDGGDDDTLTLDGDDDNDDLTLDGGDGDEEPTDDDTDTEDGDTEDGDKNDLEQIEDDIFSALSPQQQVIKTSELKGNMSSIYDNCTNLIDRINDITKTSYNASVLDKVVNSLVDLKDLVTDYLTKTFETKTYTENAIQYQKFLVVLKSVSNVLKEIEPKRQK